MKRRAFLKSVGSAAGAATLGAVSTSETLAQKNPTEKAPKGSPAHTYGLEPTEDPTDGFSLRVRNPRWYPDGEDPPGTGPTPDPPPPPARLFLEEVVGTNSNTDPTPFPVEFEYKGSSKKWILGSKIANYKAVPDEEKQLTALVSELAVLVRKYNASLYRLRRVHYCKKYPKQSTWPRPNPDGDTKDPFADPKWLEKAEGDWGSVTQALNEFLKKAREKGYRKADLPGSIRTVFLSGSDMIAVNGYIVSMRVVVGLTPVQGGKSVLEITGSSSHVSISSPFSSPGP